MWKLKALLAPAGRYVIANVLVSALGMLRNVFFMKTMAHGALGQVAILQTIVIAVGFLQLGLINGGYRLYAGASSGQERSINSNVLTGLLVIGCLLIPIVVGAELLGGAPVFAIESRTLQIGVAAGFATLLSTWLNNSLIARGKLGFSSCVNLIAASVSLGVAFFPSELTLDWALFSILLQPAVVVMAVFLLYPESRPSFHLEKKMIMDVVKLGFAPFCAGVVALMNFQIERWFVVSNLGSEALGEYYLTIVYSTVFTLVPISLLNLFYPKAVRAYESKDRPLFVSLTRRHLLVLCCYVALAVSSTFLFLPPILNDHLTSYQGLEKLVFLSIPGLVALVLFDNVVLVLQAEKRMMNIFLFVFLAFVVNVAMFSFFSVKHALTLELSASIKSGAYVFAAAAVVVDLYFRPKKAGHWK